MVDYFKRKSRFKSLWERRTSMRCSLLALKTTTISPAITGGRPACCSIEMPIQPLSSSNRRCSRSAHARGRGRARLEQRERANAELL